MVDPYESRLRSRIQEILTTGCASLTELCQRAGGAFPTDVLRLAGRSSEGLPLNGPVDSTHLTPDSAPIGAPEPHPIDFEWRFTAAAADALAEEIAAYSGRIACFGTPGVFWRLALRGREVVLYDRNPRIRRCIEPYLNGTPAHIETVDLDATCPVSASNDIVLMDPPWYLDHYEVWIAHASRIVRSGGLVVSTLFPPLLRPDACDQRRVVKEKLLELGAIERSTPILYSTPVFEQTVLEDAGLGRLGNWRMGEVLWVSVGSAPVKRTPPIGSVGPRWERFQLGLQVIAVRSDSADFGAVQLRPVGQAKSYSLGTVSSRAPHRSEINVWTSRNFAASATGIRRVIEFLHSLEAGADPQVLVGEASEEDQEGLSTLLDLIGLASIS